MTPFLLSGAKAVLKSALAPFVLPIQMMRDEVKAHPMLALLLLAVLAFVLVRAAYGHRLAALGLVPLSFAWLLFNGPLEGPTLVRLSWSHGITLSDFVAVAGFAVAGWQLVVVPALGMARGVRRTFAGPSAPGRR